MATPHPLLDAVALDELEPYLHHAGEVFAAFREQDSGCVSYGVRLPGGERWFVKHQPDGSLGEALHAAVRHPVVVPQVHRIAVGPGTAVVMPWQEGEVLYRPAPRGPGSAVARFRSLPVAEVERALDGVLDAHLAVERAGFVAVDFYDGSLLYDFARRRMHLIDLDEYRPGPFRLTADRLPGSRRYMAPEESERGAVIDSRTTVFALGRAARLLLDGGDNERAWRGTGAQFAVIARATDPVQGARHPSVAAFADAWRDATG